LCDWRLPTDSEKTITCGKLQSGEVAFGTLVETGAQAIDDWVARRDGELFTEEQVAERIAAARAAERAILRDKIANAFGG
jgi:hypothetical protein